MKKTAIGVGVICVTAAFLWVLLTFLALQSRSAQAAPAHTPDRSYSGMAVGSGWLTPAVKLNEIMVKNRSVISDEAGDFDTWIELYNGGLLPLDVGGMALSNDTIFITNWLIPTDTVIPSHSYLVIWTDGEPEEGIYHTSFALGAGQSISIFDKKVFGSALIDRAVASPTPPDWSWARHPNGDGPWTLFERPSPGAFNATHWIYLALVTRIDASPAEKIVINEFMAANDDTIADEAGEYDDWIELFNPGPNNADLSGMYLSDDLDDLLRWQIPAGTIISASGYLLLWADGQEDQGPLHTNFKLSREGETLLLVEPDGYSMRDWITFPAQLTNVSFGRVPDGASDWQFLSIPTPGYANGTPGTQGE